MIISKLTYIKSFAITLGLSLVLSFFYPEDFKAQAQSGSTVTINPSITHQTMRGWGADSSFTRDLYYLSQDVRDQIIEEAVNDTGLTFLRLGFGFLSEPFNDNSDPTNINWSAFLSKQSIDNEISTGVGLFKQKVEANGDPVSFLLDKDWETSQPSWMTDAEFAENVAATLLYYKNQYGVNINFNSIDNEPTYFDPYYPDVQRRMIKVIGPAWQNFGLSTKIALAEGFSAQVTWDFVNHMQNDSAVWPHVGLLNWHLYGGSDPYRSYLRDFGRARGIPTAMTEFPATINTLIEDLTFGGVSYWTRYHLAGRGNSPTEGGAGTYFVGDRGRTSFWKNVDYWKFRQFMRYVRPGAVRMEATSGNSSVKSFAFEKSGKRTVVLVNTGGQTSMTIQGLSQGSYGVSQAVGTQIYTELGVQSVGGSGSLAVTVPGDSILTVYPYAGTNQKPIVTDWRAAPKFVTLPASSTSLTSSAQDVELNPMTYTWSVKSKPTGANVSFNSPSSANTTASGITVAGEYVFTVTARDSVGATTARDVIVRAYSGNQPPYIAEGSRYYKDERKILPDNTSTYGPGFIDAFDLEGDPITKTFSVVSQPAGANAVFSGAGVSGMNVAGTYTFRLTVTDPTHTVTRDFNQLVVSANGAPPPLAGDINQDGIVNSLDWSIMNQRWFTSDASADLNDDGIVNSIDFSILNNNWFKTSS